MDLQKEVDAIFKDYSEEVFKTTKEVVKDVAKQAVKKLRSESPKRTGKYRKGWAQKVEQGKIEASAVIYGKTGTYQIAHLLEFGHAKRGGGRVAGIPHIAPVEEWAVQEVQNEIERRISNDAQ